MISTTHSSLLNFHPRLPLLVKTPSLEEKVTLNPQPLPSGSPEGFKANWEALKTQPLVLNNANGNVKSAGLPADWITLNPQPLPPRVATGQSFNSIPTSEMNKGIIIIGGRTAIR